MTAVNTWLVQKALVAHLKADTPLATLVGGEIYDRRPDNADLVDYVAVGETIGTDAGTQGADGLEEIVTLHTWSRYAGSMKVKQIMHAIRASLNKQSLTVSGLSSCHAFVDVGQVLPLDPDGNTRHGVQRVRLICRE